MKYITLWRNPESPLDWDHFVSHSEEEMKQVVTNLQKQLGARQFSTYELGERLADFSKDFS